MVSPSLTHFDSCAFVASTRFSSGPLLLRPPSPSRCHAGPRPPFCTDTRTTLTDNPHKRTEKKWRIEFGPKLHQHQHQPPSQGLPPASKPACRLAIHIPSSSPHSQLTDSCVHTGWRLLLFFFLFLLYSLHGSSIAAYLMPAHSSPSTITILHPALEHLDRRSRNSCADFSLASSCTRCTSCPRPTPS